MQPKKWRDGRVECLLRLGRYSEKWWSGLRMDQEEHMCKSVKPRDTAGNVLERYVYDPYGTPTFLTANYSSESGSAYAWSYYSTGILKSCVVIMISRPGSDSLTKMYRESPSTLISTVFRCSGRCAITSCIFWRTPALSFVRLKMSSAHL